MARSIKKGPFVDIKLMKKVDVMNETSKKSVIKTWSPRINPGRNDFSLGNMGYSGRKFTPPSPINF
jgi:small subunit ribosomal protein S19